jgi:glycosyltransferase involved in cell wall biosynthesis
MEMGFINNKKILIVTEYFYPEEFKINEIALAWKKKGYEVDVLTSYPTYPLGEVFEGYKNRWYSKEKYEGITIYRTKAVIGYKKSLFKKILKYFMFMILGSIVGLRIGKKYDYIFGFNQSTLTGMIPAVIVKKIYKKPLTFWALDIWPDSVYAYGFKKTKLLSFFLDKFVSFMYRNVDNIAISGKGFESKLRPYVRKNQVFNYLPNWADKLDMSLEAVKFSEEDKIHFMFAGNIGKLQNLENVIKGFCLLSPEYQEKSQFNIIGDGSALEELRKISNNASNIIFHGKKPRKDMAKYYKASDFLIVSLIDKPIFSVTVPAKLQTYIAAKKPILSIINGDTSKIVEENNLGYCTEPNDIIEIKNSFVKCINTEKEEIKEFTKNCELLTNTIFNKEKIIDSLLSLLTKEGK